MGIDLSRMERPEQPNGSLDITSPEAFIASLQRFDPPSKLYFCHICSQFMIIEQDASSDRVPDCSMCGANGVMEEIISGDELSAAVAGRNVNGRNEDVQTAMSNIAMAYHTSNAMRTVVNMFGGENNNADAGVEERGGGGVRITTTTTTADGDAGSPPFLMMQQMLRQSQMQNGGAAENAQGGVHVQFRELNSHVQELQAALAQLRSVGTIGNLDAANLERVIQISLNPSHPQQERTPAALIDELPRVVSGMVEDSDREMFPHMKMGRCLCMDEMHFGEGSPQNSAVTASRTSRDDGEIDEIIVILPCGHCFHETCILPWLEKANTCPMCRHVISSAMPEPPASPPASSQQQ